MTQNYITQNEADEILAEVYGAEEWDNLTDDTKARAITTACDNIDALGTLLSGYKGEKSDPAQSREFPRTSTDNTLPDDLKRAAAFEALHIANMSETQCAIKSGLRSKRVGNASETYVSGKSEFVGSDTAALMKKHLNFFGKGAFDIT